MGWMCPQVKGTRCVLGGRALGKQGEGKPTCSEQDCELPEASGVTEGKTETTLVSAPHSTEQLHKRGLIT